MCLYLRNRRAALGLSQLAVAARLGVPQNIVSRWEQYGLRGHEGPSCIEPPSEKLFAWAAALGVSILLTSE